MQYHSPSAFCLLPCSICPLIRTLGEGLNSCYCLVLKLKLCNVFISLYMFLSVLAPVVPTNIYHSSFYRRIYCSPIYTLNNLWYYCTFCLSLSVQGEKFCIQNPSFLQNMLYNFFTNAPIFRKTSFYQNWHYHPISEFSHSQLIYSLCIYIFKNSIFKIIYVISPVVPQCRQTTSIADFMVNYNQRISMSLQPSVKNPSTVIPTLLKLFKIQILISLDCAFEFISKLCSVLLL